MAYNCIFIDILPAIELDYTGVYPYNKHTDAINKYKYKITVSITHSMVCVCVDDVFSTILNLLRRHPTHVMYNLLYTCVYIMMYGLTLRNMCAHGL